MFLCCWVQWPWALHHSSRCLALRVVILGLCAAAQLWKPIWRTMFALTLLTEAVLELGSECCNRRQKIFPRYALQHLAVPFCELVWPTTSPLSCYFSWTFPLHNNSTYSWPGQLEQCRDLMNWLVKVASCGGAMLKVTELCSAAHSTANVCLWRLHGCLLDFIHLSAMGGTEISKSTN